MPNFNRYRSGAMQAPSSMHQPRAVPNSAGMMSNANSRMHGRNQYYPYARPMNSPNMQAPSMAYSPAMMANSFMTPQEEFAYKLRELMSRYMGSTTSGMGLQRGSQRMSRDKIIKYLMGAAKGMMGNMGGI